MFQHSINTQSLPNFRMETTALYAAATKDNQRIITVLEAVCAQSAPPTFKNTIEPMEAALMAAHNSYQTFAVQHATANTTNSPLDQLYQELSMQRQTHIAYAFQNDAFGNRIDAIIKNNTFYGSPKQQEEQRRLAEIYNFRCFNNGVYANDRDKDILQSLTHEISKHNSAYNKSLSATRLDHSVLEPNTQRLTGLSKGQLAHLRKAAENYGQTGYLITPVNTAYHPLLQHLSNRALREAIYRQHTNRGIGNNDQTWKIAKEVCALRSEKARILGYTNWANYVNSEQTAASISHIDDFLLPMAESIMPALQTQIRLFKYLLHEDGYAGDLKPWDFPYYLTKYKEQKYELDFTTLRDYFSFENVLEHGVFFTLQQLYGISFIKREGIPTCHEDVLAYEVVEEGTSLGFLYLDCFARNGKREGAWHTAVHTPYLRNGNRAATLVGTNFAKGPAGSPILLEPADVETLFHEMGHAMHALLTEATFVSTAGTNVPRDIVEFPSMLHQYFAFTPQVLQNYARHHKTGEILPQNLQKALIGSMQENKLFHTYGYITSMLLDLEFHQMGAIPKGCNPHTLAKKILSEYNLDLKALVPPYNFGHFPHLFKGYAGLCYGYLWAEVFAADLFEHISQTHGALSKEAGTLIRRFLAIGNNVPFTTFYEQQLGRMPDVSALLRLRTAVS